MNESFRCTVLTVLLTRKNKGKQIVREAQFTQTNFHGNMHSTVQLYNVLKFIKHKMFSKNQTS